MYIVIEIDPATGNRQILFPKNSLIQIHVSLESAERHRDWYIHNVYVEDPDTGRLLVSVYALQPVLSGLARLATAIAPDLPAPSAAASLLP